MHCTLHYTMHCTIHCSLQCNMQYTLHFTMHFTLHCTALYTALFMHNQCIINNCWRSLPLLCGQYMAIFLLLHEIEFLATTFCISWCLFLNPKSVSYQSSFRISLVISTGGAVSFWSDVSLYVMTPWVETEQALLLKILRSQYCQTFGIFIKDLLTPEMDKD